MKTKILLLLLLYKHYLLYSYLASKYAYIIEYFISNLKNNSDNL